MGPPRDADRPEPRRTLEDYLAGSLEIPGWTRGAEAGALALASHDLPPNAVVLEIGCFLGGSAVLLAGARKLRGSGVLHCVDPFDGTGDPYSIPFYREIIAADARSLRQRFDANLERLGLKDWVRVHPGTAETVAASWTIPIDMLFLDGDQSPAGVEAAFSGWAPFLRPGGVLALHNSDDRIYSEGHDGHRRLALALRRLDGYEIVSVVGTTTFAAKTSR
jgi:predicted O-methyltransferase YrrM